MTTKKFLVGIRDNGFEELDFAIVNASNETQALEAYIKNVEIKKEIYLSFAYDKSGDGFAHVFYKKSGYPISREELRDQAQKFFGTHDDFAQAYFDFYWNVNEGRKTYTLFSAEMLTYMAMNSDWTDAFTVVPLIEIIEIQA